MTIAQSMRFWDCGSQNEVAGIGFEVAGITSESVKNGDCGVLLRVSRSVQILSWAMPKAIRSGRRVHFRKVGYIRTK